MPPRARPSLYEIQPYVGGVSKLDGKERVIKLSSNENTAGPSPKAIAAVQASASSIHLYPDGGYTALREAIGAAHDLDPSRIVVGAGSDEIIGLLSHAYAKEGDTVIHTEHGFLMYKIYAQSGGATPVAVPETDLTADVDAILRAVTAHTRIVFLANPNNPTGTYLPESELMRLREGLREDILLVIDGAYAEYVTAEDYADGRALVDAGENTVITRTFSKIYGLPSLRLGWGYCPAAIADVLNRARGPFNVSGAAAAAGIAAVADQAYVREARDRNTRERDRLTATLPVLGFEFVPSQGNFVLVRCADAEKTYTHLTGAGIIVRKTANYGLPEYLRITVGTDEENTALLKALEEYRHGHSI